MDLGSLFITVAVLLTCCHVPTRSFVLDTVADILSPHHGSSSHSDSDCETCQDCIDLKTLISAQQCTSDTQVWQPLQRLLVANRHCLGKAIEEIAASTDSHFDPECSCNTYFNKQVALPLGGNYDHYFECMNFDGNCKALFSYFYVNPGELHPEMNCQTHNHVWTMLAHMGYPGHIDLIASMIYHLAATFKNGTQNICSCQPFTQTSTQTPTQAQTQTPIPTQPQTQAQTTTPTPTERATTTVKVTSTTSNNPTTHRAVPAITTEGTPSTTPKHKRRCAKYHAVFDIAEYVIETHPLASLCPSGDRSSSEAYVLVNCNVTDPAHWTAGINVMENCDVLPTYTPIATFDTVYQGMSGIFLGCTQTGFKIAAQHCDHEPDVLYIERGKGTNTQDPDVYYVIQ